MLLYLFDSTQENNTIFIKKEMIQVNNILLFYSKKKLFKMLIKLQLRTANTN